MKKEDKRIAIFGIVAIAIVCILAIISPANATKEAETTAIEVPQINLVKTDGIKGTYDGKTQLNDISEYLSDFSIGATQKLTVHTAIIDNNIELIPDKVLLDFSKDDNKVSLTLKQSSLSVSITGKDTYELAKGFMQRIGLKELTLNKQESINVTGKGNSNNTRDYLITYNADKDEFSYFQVCNINTDLVVYTAKLQIANKLPLYTTFGLLEDTPLCYSDVNRLFSTLTTDIDMANLLTKESDYLIFTRETYPDNESTEFATTSYRLLSKCKGAGTSLKEKYGSTEINGMEYIPVQSIDGNFSNSTFKLEFSTLNFYLEKVNKKGIINPIKGMVLYTSDYIDGKTTTCIPNSNYKLEYTKDTSWLKDVTRTNKYAVELVEQ